ncbi:hypothetical protein [Salmonella phage SD-1_S14]|nr:hypothetical protein [Salmonella phage SD-2_S15]WPK19832.1 hypothetical protein [Salmonella phage SD-1_S14]
MGVIPHPLGFPLSRVYVVIIRFFRIKSIPKNKIIENNLTRLNCP